ncbi:MAG: PD-(D/E)XK nuclease family protein, partial [Myxococcales bacterium]|nr:PD-(D/E)XK nuclease family protein [Myxococcales bacterium]
PGGSGVGVFLHEVLEHLSFERVAETPILDDPPMRDLLVARARANGIGEEHLPEAARILEGALRSPLPLPRGGEVEGGLASLARRVAEMPFLLPIPEASHPPIDAGRPGLDAPPLAIDRGFIRGIIDLVAEHEGRYLVVDYKSDRLASYAPADVARHVEAHYQVQARLYTIGAVRALRIHDAADYEARFEGLLYTFLRGMSGGGVWASRPSWQDVLTWERALLGETPWGHPLPARRRA